MLNTKEHKENVLIVVVDYKSDRHSWNAEDICEEMKELVSACSGEVVESMICRIDKPTARYLIGEGKVDEIVNVCSMMDIDTVIFSHDLKGGQQRNLEEKIQAKTIDRTQLILDIFARHATSKEGKMQVELAQLEYLLPRLVGKGIELSRLGGGIGTLGPGETQLEIDRRRIDVRIDLLKKSLKEVTASRSITRKQRKSRGVPTVSLVGYTNAGKSTLLNCLTQAGQKTRDGLFTTLDSLSRKMTLPNNQKIVLSDTVGFMHNLPHHLIESFKATLEEVSEADVLLHVLDVSNENFKYLQESVEVVLKELKAHEKPTIMVLNKIDRVKSVQDIEFFAKNFDHSVCISASESTNIDGLYKEIENVLSKFILEVDVQIPIDRMDLVNRVHKEGQVLSIKYYDTTINIRACVSQELCGQLHKVDQNAPQKPADEEF